MWTIDETEEKEEEEDTHIGSRLSLLSKVPSQTYRTLRRVKEKRYYSNMLYIIESIS